MYKVEINGSFSGNFSTAHEALAHVEERARPYGHRWVIYDPYGKTYAQG